MVASKYEECPEKMLILVKQFNERNLLPFVLNILRQSKEALDRHAFFVLFVLFFFFCEGKGEREGRAL